MDKTTTPIIIDGQEVNFISLSTSQVGGTYISVEIKQEGTNDLKMYNGSIPDALNLSFEYSTVNLTYYTGCKFTIYYLNNTSKVPFYLVEEKEKEIIKFLSRLKLTNGEITFPSSLKRGKLIVVEGVDGVGKTTIVEGLLNSLNELGIGEFVSIKTLTTDNLTGKALREMISVKQNEIVDGDRLIYNYLSEIIYHFKRKGGVEDLLDNGINVILDRSYLSTLAYCENDYMREIALKTIDLKLPILDIVIYVTASNETINSRIQSRGIKKEYYEDENKREKQNTVFGQYLFGGWEKIGSRFEVENDGNVEIDTIIADTAENIKEML